MKTTPSIFAACVLATVCCSARPQALERVAVLAEPLQYSKAGAFRGCGLNLKLMKEESSTSLAYLTLSMNFWLDSPSHGLAKFAFSKVRPGPTPELERKPIASPWARLKPAKALSMIQPVSGDDESILSTVPLDQAVDFVNAVVEQEAELQVGFKEQGSDFERVFYGTPTVSPETGRQLRDCFDEFRRHLNTMIKKGKPS